jgi:replicative DNA helicase
VNPHLEAERVLLGAAMLDSRTVDACADILRVEHFDSEWHRRVWLAICAVIERGDEPDVLRVKHELGAASDAEGVDLGALLDGLPALTNVTPWARQVREAARRRSLRSVAAKLLEAVDGEEGTDEILDRHATQVQRLSQASESRHTWTFDVAIKQALEDIDKSCSAPEGMTGVPTGLLDFDKLTGGLQVGTLSVIAARPRRGKSVFCAQTAMYAAARGRRVLMFSLEMRPRQVARRMLLAEAEVDRYALRHQQGARDKVAATAGAIASLPIWLDDRESPTLQQIRAAAKRLQSAGGLDLVIIDYLQRCQVDRKQDRWKAIGELAAGLKSLSMALEVPVLTACQVGREGEMRKPTLADLRESGDIEQEADIVAILHPHTQPGKSPDEVMEQEFPQVDLWVEKHRDGAEMCIPLSFERKYVRFVSQAQSQDWRGDRA